MKAETKILIFLCCLSVFGATVALKDFNKGTLIFSHEHHVKKQGAACVDCHTTADTSTLSIYNLLPSMQACYECHDETETDCGHCHKAKCKVIENRDKCASCHMRKGSALPKAVPRELINSHKSHALKEIDCKTCHLHVAEKTSPGTETVPDMLVCITCHDKEKISIRCHHCHSDQELVQSHDAGWSRRHGDNMFGEDRAECVRCHTQNYCDQCHMGLVAEEVHSGNYRFTHSLDALGSDDKCRTCHQTSSFCDDCHARSWGRLAIDDHRMLIKNTKSCKECHD